MFGSLFSSIYGLILMYFMIGSSNEFISKNFKSKLCNRLHNNSSQEDILFCLLFDIILLYLIDIYFIQTHIKKNKRYIYNNNFYLITLRVFCLVILKIIIYAILDINLISNILNT